MKMACNWCKILPHMQTTIELSLEQTQKLSYSKNVNQKYSFECELCIFDEIKSLLENGIITLESCCGHKKILPYALINSDYHDKAIDLGYTLQHQGNGIYKIILKSKLGGI